MILITNELDVLNLIDNLYYNDEQKIFIKFKYSFLKNIFFSELKHYKPIKIINCDSSTSRFQNDISSISDEYLIIYDNIGNGDDYLKDILYSKQKGIFIC